MASQRTIDRARPKKRAARNVDRYPPALGACVMRLQSASERQHPLVGCDEPCTLRDRGRGDDPVCWVAMKWLELGRCDRDVSVDRNLHDAGLQRLDPKRFWSDAE